MNPIILFYHLIVLFILGMMIVNFLLNQIAVPHLHRNTPPPINPPKVSILVPARDEEAVIERCLRSLQLQDYPNFEIILLDDQSSDRTGAIATELGFVSGEGKFRLIRGQTLEPGWVGKPWACHQLSQVADGEYLLFTDADTDHSRSALSSAMNTALGEKTHLLTLWPFQETKTWSEKLIIPLIYVAAAGALPHWLLRLCQRNPVLCAKIPPRILRYLGGANGQYVLFSRKGYQQIGGHEAVKNGMVEDVGLGRLAAQKTGEGFILLNCDGTDVVTTRMYRSFPQLWEGFTKNAWPVFDGKFFLFCLGGVGQFLVICGPFLFLPLAGDSWWMLLFQILLIYFIRIIFSLRYRTSWLGALFHPFACMLGTAIAINSYLQNKKEGLTWKGRTYQVD